MTKPKTKPAPPITDEERLDTLCNLLEEGEMYTAVCKRMGIAQSTMNRWLAAEPARSARVREARISSAAAYADKAEQVIAEAKDDFALRKAKELAHQHRWRASKLSPGQYGDKVEVGVDLNATVTHIERTVVWPKGHPGGD